VTTFDNPESIGRLYDSMAAPMIRAGKLHGYVTPDEIHERFSKITDDIVLARRAKIADEDWAAWTAAADELEAAGQQVRALKREMGAAVDAAKGKRFHVKLMILGVVLSTALGAGVTLLIEHVL
jgi:hypothetical protein